LSRWKWIEVKTSTQVGRGKHDRRREGRAHKRHRQATPIRGRGFDYAAKPPPGASIPLGGGGHVDGVLTGTIPDFKGNPDPGVADQG